MVYGALVSHHHWCTGRCFPGYRAIARLAKVSLSTVSASIKRLKAAGFIKVRPYRIRILGHGLRWAHSYTLIPAPRSEIVAEPEFIKILKKNPTFRQQPATEPTRSVEEQLAVLKPFIRAEKGRGLGKGASPGSCA